MSKEGERGTSPLGDSKGGVPALSGVGQSDAGISVEAPQVVGQGMVSDASVLASILNQACGQILDRLRRQLSPFAGECVVEISEWLVAYERLCVVEHVAPIELLTYMLAGNAAQVYSSLLLGEASLWEVVKAVLAAEYAMPRQEAWHRYVNCRLSARETVDVYLGCLERLGSRLDLILNDMASRVNFYEALPASVYEWAVTHEQAHEPASVYSCARPYSLAEGSRKGLLILLPSLLILVIGRVAALAVIGVVGNIVSRNAPQNV